MFGYLKNTDLSVRLSINPFHWKWIPSVVYDGPTPFYPKRRTFAFIFLFLQMYLDVDNGTTDMEKFNQVFHSVMDAYDEQSDVGHSLPSPSETHSGVE